MHMHVLRDQQELGDESKSCQWIKPSLELGIRMSARLSTGKPSVNSSICAILDNISKHRNC